MAAETFAEMAVRLHDEGGLEQTVDLVLEYALKAVGCDYAGVIFVHGRSQVETIAATDPLVVELDLIQMKSGQGPDLDALDDRISLIVDDTETDQRWPDWAALVAGSGIRSLLNVRLYTSETTIGTLNLYSRKPNQFDTDDQEVAHTLARHAAVAIGTARKEENLWRAADARKLIGQAQGMLMERFSLSEDQAFAVLLRYSQDQNIKLRAVAEQLVRTRTLPD